MKWIWQMNFTFISITIKSDNFTGDKWLNFLEDNKVWVTSMLVTDIGDQMCWWQVWDIGDRFRMLMINLIY